MGDPMPTKVANINNILTNVTSMFDHDAKPPQTPASFLSVLLRDNLLIL